MPNYTEFSVTVKSTGDGNKYYINNIRQMPLALTEGSVYRFDVSDSSVSGHGLLFSETRDGTHNSGSTYSTGVTASGTAGSADAYVEIVVAENAPDLFYYCVNHSGMGGPVETVGGSSFSQFSLNVADYIEEAFERCGLEVRTGYDLKTAKRSMNLLFADWANRGLNRWTINQDTVSLVAGTSTYNLDANTIDVLSAVVRQNAGQSTQSDIQIDRVSRDVFLNIPNKLSQARPVQFYVDRSVTPVLNVWPTPDKAYTFVYDRLKRIEDADTMTNTVEVPFRFYPCLAAGLAYYLSMKKAPDRMAMLKASYEEEFNRAAFEDVDRANLSLTPRRDYYGFR